MSNTHRYLMCCQNYRISLNTFCAIMLTRRLFSSSNVSTICTSSQELNRETENYKIKTFSLLHLTGRTNPRFTVVRNGCKRVAMVTTVDVKCNCRQQQNKASINPTRQSNSAHTTLLCCCCHSWTPKRLWVLSPQQCAPGEAPSLFHSQFCVSRHSSQSPSTRQLSAVVCWSNDATVALN